MNRRDFLATTAAAALMPQAGQASIDHGPIRQMNWYGPEIPCLRLYPEDESGAAMSCWGVIEFRTYEVDPEQIW